MIGKNSPSRRWRSASLAPQTAQHQTKVSSTGSSTAGEVLMMRRILLIAACCSTASVRARWKREPVPTTKGVLPRLLPLVGSAPDACSLTGLCQSTTQNKADD